MGIWILIYGKLHETMTCECTTNIHFYLLIYINTIDENKLYDMKIWYAFIVNKFLVMQLQHQKLVL